jgi:hypothetical protein
VEALIDDPNVTSGSKSANPRLERRLVPRRQFAVVGAGNLRQVDAAFGLVPAAPAARARVFAGEHRAGARLQPTERKPTISTICRRRIAMFFTVIGFIEAELLPMGRERDGDRLVPAAGQLWADSGHS